MRGKERAQARAKAQVMTFTVCTTARIDAQKAGWKSPKHAVQWTNTLNTYAGLVFGVLPVAEVDTGMVLKCQTTIWETKSETASRLRGRVEPVLGRTTTSGYRPGENPAPWKGHLENFVARGHKVGQVRHRPTNSDFHIGWLGFSAHRFHLVGKVLGRADVVCL
jgi:hypothetical protein